LIKINDQIKSPEVRVIDDTGANIGVLSLEQAKALAKEKGLDLIEISPNAKPPVVKIISFDKYRYQEEKKLKKQRAQQRGGDMKRVQISVRAAQHDLEIKAGQVNEFLAEGNQVEIQLTLRGREKGNKDWARYRLEEFMKMITPEHKVIADVRFGGRGLNIQIAKK